MDFLEKDLEEIIYNSDKKVLEENGLYLHGKLKRQLSIGSFGRTDLIEYQRPYFNPYDNLIYKGQIKIIELKNKKIGVSTFFQALNYLEGIRRYLSNKNIEQNYNYTICLIGREIDVNSSFKFLSNNFNVDFNSFPIHFESLVNIELFQYEYNLKGLIFKEI